MLGPQLILLVLYNVCFVLPLIVIIVTLTVAGDQAERVLERTRDLLQRHWPALVAGLALLAGVFVTLLGATGLASARARFPCTPLEAVPADRSPLKRTQPRVPATLERDPDASVYTIRTIGGWPTNQQRE